MSYFIEFSSHPQANPSEIHVSREVEDEDEVEDGALTSLTISFGAYAVRMREYRVIETFTVSGTDDVKFLEDDRTLSRVAIGEEWVLSNYAEEVERKLTLWLRNGIASGTFWIVVNLAGTEDQRPPESDFCEIRVVEAESGEPS